MADMGVAVYEILENGCLNGVYCNLDKSSNNTVMNEIARRIEPKEVEKTDDKLLGKYKCAYIDYDGEVYECGLTIEAGPGSGHGAQYILVWDNPKKDIHFKGDGWLTRENQLTVHYMKVTKP